MIFNFLPDSENDRIFVHLTFPLERTNPSRADIFYASVFLYVVRSVTYDGWLAPTHESQRTDHFGFQNH